MFNALSYFTDRTYDHSNPTDPTNPGTTPRRKDPREDQRHARHPRPPARNRTGGEHDATEHDRLTATGILFDRGYGKCPKQAPAGIDSAPETNDNDVGALREAPPADSPRLVTQLDNSLHDSLGPVPETESAKAGGGGEPALSEVEGSIQSTICDHIISITNDGDTLIDFLVDIAWPEDRTTRPFHRNRASKMLLERAAGRDLHTRRNHRPVTSRTRPK